MAPNGTIPSRPSTLHLMKDLKDFLSDDEIFTKHQPQYKAQSEPWSNHAELHPLVVVQPLTIDSMRKTVKYLYDSTLDFGVRNTGTGSVSARDVILSTHGFKSFHFDKAAEIVTIGSGLDWGEVDALMLKEAPGYAVVGARCSWVGVTGSALVGGLSWLSHEYGMICDPQNLLDMQIVLADGRVLWASEESDLMWALRGGGGNFGVVTALRLRARPYPDKVFAGIVFLPYSSLREVSKGVATMHAQKADGKVCMHVTNQGPGMGMPDQGSKPGIAILMFDAHGEAHARSEAFKWALDIECAQMGPGGEMPIQKVNALGETFRDYQGNNMFWLSAPLIADVDDETLVRTWKWYEDSINLYEGLGAGSTVLLEFMQEAAFSSAGSRAATAWPHHGRRHVLQVVLGCRPGGPADIKNIVHKQMQVLDKQVAREEVTGEFHAGFLHEWNNLDEVYGENLPKLRGIKRRYDPRNRFNKGVDLTEGGGAVTKGMTV